MAIAEWIGAALDVAQVTRIVFSAYTIGQTYTLTINGKSVSYVAVAATGLDVWTGLAAAWEGSLIAELQEATATVSSGVLLTGDTAGKPFTVTATATGGITSTITTVTACTGKNYRTNPANWLAGTVPAAGDTLLFRNCSVSMLYDLVDVGTNYGDIIVESTFTGAIGLPAETGTYREYRPRFLKLGNGTNAFKVQIGQGTGSQPSRVMIDANQATLTVQVYGTGQNIGNERPVVIKNTNNVSTMEFYGGWVLIDGDSSGAAASMKILTNSNSPNGCDVLCSLTVACGVVTTSGGTMAIWGSATSVDANNGSSVTICGAATCPTIRSSSQSYVYWASTAGVTTLAESRPKGTIDFSRNGTAKAVANATCFTDGAMLDPMGVVTWTNKIQLSGCTLQECRIDVGRNKAIGT